MTSGQKRRFRHGLTPKAAGLNSISEWTKNEKNGGQRRSYLPIGQSLTPTSFLNSHKSDFFAPPINSIKLPFDIVFHALTASAAIANITRCSNARRPNLLISFKVDLWVRLSEGSDTNVLFSYSDCSAHSSLPAEINDRVGWHVVVWLPASAWFG